MKDQDDKIFEALFAADPIEDDGFSERTLKKLQRKIWVRRLSLPVAFTLGSLIAFKSLSELGLSLIDGFTKLLDGAMHELQSLPPSQTSEVSMILGLLLMFGIPLMSKLFEE